MALSINWGSLNLHRLEAKDSDPTWCDVARFLRSKAAYPQQQAPEVIETHISLVFLTGSIVYKLKKPVHFDFLDFASREARHAACDQEIALNRRLAPDMYLGTVAVTVDAAGGFAIGGPGQPVEWLVKMRRLPRDLMLDALLSMGKGSSVNIKELSSVLINFYRKTTPLPMSMTSLVPQMLQHIRGNLSELSRPANQLPNHLVKRIHGFQIRFVHFEQSLFEARISSRRFVDGHGDLRPEHICMESPPTIFDCIEFNAEFRHIDTADELAFLAVECERLHARDIGDTILNECVTALDDQPPLRLIDFYKSYRACVRAKVAALRSSQAGVDWATSIQLATTYLNLADRCLGPTSRPICIIVRGLIGSGKSTVATALADILGMELLQTDIIRRDLISEPAETRRYGVGPYTAENRGVAYERMFEAAAALLSERVSVVLDACFLTHALQQRVYALTQSMGVSLLIVNCHCPVSVATERIIARAREPGCASEALPEHLTNQNGDDEGCISMAPILAIDTSLGTTDSHIVTIKEHLQDIAARLHG